MISQTSEDFKIIFEYLNKYYKDDENSSLISALEFVNKAPLSKNQTRKFLKKVFQFLLHYNFTILKISSTNSFRHYFPKKLTVSDNLKTFFDLLSKILESIKIKIKLLDSSKLEGKISYFYFEDYESILRGLLYWDNNYIQFSQDKIPVLKEFFKSSEIFVFFYNKYIDHIFGDNGIIKKQNLPLTKFFNNIFEITKYKRHSIYKWREDKYFPISVLYDLYKSKYSQDVDKDFLKYVKYIKVGKTQQISKELLNKIRNNYQNSIYQFIVPSNSFFGYLLNYRPLIEEIDILTKYENFIEKYPKERLEKLVLESIDEAENVKKLQNFDDFVKEIKESIFSISEAVYLKELHVRNFKSYLDEKIYFQKGINILWGLNGSGKTTVFDAMLFALFIPLGIRNKYKLKRLYPVELDCLDTHFIHFGKKFCEVKLVLTRENEDIIIKRKLWKNGKHQILINDIDILHQIDIREKEVRKKSLSELINKKHKILEKTKYRKEMDEYLAEVDGISFEILNLIDYDDFNFIDPIENKDFLNQHILIQYIRDIRDQIQIFYKKSNCFFQINDILSTFFLDFKSIYSLFSNPSLNLIKLEEFYYKKMNLNFLYKTIENARMRTEFYKVQFDRAMLELIEFLKDSFEFLYDTYLSHVKKKFEEFSKEFFQSSNMISSLDEDGIPIIKFNHQKEKFPLNILSGGEKSKLILGLLSILIGISNKTSFFLIDEPNELLDSNNVEIMKKFFFKLFKNKQLIISTFVDNYKDFQPALTYEVWKDHNNISHAFRLDRNKEIFTLYKKMDEIEKKIEQNPKDYHLKQRKLAFLIELGKYEDALDFFYNLKDLGLDIFDNVELIGSNLEKLINLEKNKVEDKENKAKIYYIRALIYYQLKELHQAIEDIDEAIKLGLNIPEVYDFKSHCLLYTNKPNMALKTLDEGINKFPDHTGYYGTKCDILEILGKYEEALSEINNAIEIDKNKPWNYYKKAYILGRGLERFDEALDNINKALDYNPEDGIYNSDKINYLINLQKFDEAYATLEKYKDSIPHPDQVICWIYEEEAYYNMKKGEKDKAINLLDKLIEKDPKEAQYFNSYGKILMHFEDYKNALKQFEKAKELPFTPNETYIKMGKCLLELGRYEEALADLRIGRNSAAHSVKSSTLTEDDKRITVDAPQTELIKEVENYIAEVEKKLKEQK